MKATECMANCPVMSPTDASHVSVKTPMDLKIKELKEADTDENPVRVREVNKRRTEKSGSVKPI